MRTMTRLLGVASLLFAATVAARHPLTTVAPAATCYDSLQAAAVAGLLAAAARSRRVEYGGALFQRNARCFVHSIPVTSNQPSQLEYRVSTHDHEMALVGIYHTHTPGRFAHRFSDHDVAMQRELGVDSWLATLDASGRHLTIRCLPAAGEQTTSVLHAVIGSAKRQAQAHPSPAPNTAARQGPSFR